MKRNAKIALVSLLSVGFVATATGTGFSLWASIQKEDTTPSFSEVGYTVNFYKLETDEKPYTTYTNLEIDSSFSLPWIDDTETQHFKGWKEAGESTIFYTDSLKLTDITSFDRTNKTLSLYAVYDPILTINVTCSSPKQVSYSTKVIIDTNPYLYLLSNLAIDNEFTLNKVDYKLVSFSSTATLTYKELQSNGEWASEDKTGTKFGINDGLVLNPNMVSTLVNSTLTLTANYVEVLG